MWFVLVCVWVLVGICSGLIPQVGIEPNPGPVTRCSSCNQYMSTNAGVWKYECRSVGGPSESMHRSEVAQGRCLI
jgi:hypothetical protein